MRVELLQVRRLRKNVGIFIYFYPFRAATPLINGACRVSRRFADLNICDGRLIIWCMSTAVTQSMFFARQKRLGPKVPQLYVAMYQCVEARAIYGSRRFTLFEFKYYSIISHLPPTCHWPGGVYSTHCISRPDVFFTILFVRYLLHIYIPVQTMDLCFGLVF